MSFPDRGSGEWRAMEQRVNRSLTDVVSNVAQHRHLPDLVHVMVYDDVTGEYFGAFEEITYLQGGPGGRVQRNRQGLNAVRPDVPLTRIVDTLIEVAPDVPLVCDATIAEELRGESIPWLDEGHYRLDGRPGGVIEVYTPHTSIKLFKRKHPKGVAGGQLFTE